MSKDAASAKKSKAICVEVWGANVSMLLDIPNVEVCMTRWRGCDDSCPAVEHDPIAKVYAIAFPQGTCATRVKLNTTDYALPDGSIVRVVEGGENFYDKVITYPAKPKAKK